MLLSKEEEEEEEEGEEEEEEEEINGCKFLSKDRIKLMSQLN